MCNNNRSCDTGSRFLRCVAIAGCMIVALVAGSGRQAAAQWYPAGAVIFTCDQAKSAGGAAAFGGTSFYNSTPMSVTASATYFALPGEVSCPEFCHLTNVTATQRWISTFDTRINLAITEHVQGVVAGTQTPGGVIHADTSSSAMSKTGGISIGVGNPPSGSAGEGTPNPSSSTYGPPAPPDRVVNFAGRAFHQIFVKGGMAASADAYNAVDGNDPLTNKEGLLEPSSATAYASISPVSVPNAD